MKLAVLFLLCLAVAIPMSLSAQTTNSIMQFEGFQLPKADTLTGTYSGFVHINWANAGVGVSLKHLMFMYNKTVLPQAKNYKADVSMEDVTTQAVIPDYKVNYKYDTIMAGYMIHLFGNVYPYAGTGTVIRTDMVEVQPDTISPDVYTVTGKNTTFATGIVGVIIALPQHVIIEGSLQLNPLLPYLGVGIRL